VGAVQARSLTQALSAGEPSNHISKLTPTSASVLLQMPLVAQAPKPQVSSCVLKPCSLAVRPKQLQELLLDG
jgi:hypothetical protein